MTACIRYGADAAAAGGQTEKPADSPLIHTDNT